MREIIDKILDGNFTTENTALDFSCSRIEITVPCNQDYEGCFHVFSSDRMLTEGFVNSSDLRMECGSFQANGRDTEISFCFHTTNCDPGEVVKGSFCIVSNQGEYSLPFFVTVTAPIVDSGYGKLENLNDFVNLARYNWNEAVRIFYSGEFRYLLDESDKNLISDYRAMSANRGNEHNLEEFLICSGKKKIIQYVTKTPVVEISTSHVMGGEGPYQQEIEIIRDGWGYTHLTVECEGDFLFTQDTILRDEDFQGNLYTLDLFVDLSKCRTGKYYGKVKISSPYQLLEIPVCINAANARKKQSLEKNRQSILFQLTRDYLEMRLKKLPLQQWILRSGQLTEQLLSRDDKDIIAQLFKAQLLVTQERINEAGWNLDRAADLLEEKINSLTEDAYDYQLPYCYHAYLTTLVRTEEDYVKNVTQRIERIYKKNREDWRLAWLLLYLPSQYSADAASRWSLMEYLFEHNAISPIMYLEIMQDVNSNPTVIRSLNGFAIQVLHFGAKWHVLSENVLEQILYLAGKVREEKPLLRKSLELLYEDYPQSRVLQEICSQLIKSGVRSPKAKEWYRLGIEQELRLTNLYEYYIQSLDLTQTEEIPKLALMYFSYQNNLDYEHMAYLYHYMLRRRREMADIYNNNRPAMEKFAFEQIGKRRINRHLAAIYDEILTPGMLDRALAAGLADLLFSNWLRIEKGSFEKVYVYQKGAKNPRAFDIRNGEGWVAIYGNEYTLVLEDGMGNRYLQGVEYTLEKLMLPGRYLRKVADFVWDHTRLNLYLCDYGQDAFEVTQENMLRYLQLSESEELGETDRNKRLLQVMEYYYANKDTRSLERGIMKLRGKQMPADMRAKLLHLMVVAGFIQEAADYVHKNGFYYADASDIERLIEQAVGLKSFAADEVWDYAAAFCLRNGKPGSPVIKYLVAHYQGLSKELRDVWKKAVHLEMAHQKLSERLLIQLLYTGGFVGEEMEIFFDYAKGENGDLKLVRAFLAQATFDYFVREKIMPDELFVLLQGMIMRDMPTQKVSKLAFLKYFSDKPEQLDDGKRRIILQFLQEMMAERIHLGFFMNYRNNAAFPEGELRAQLLLCLEDMINLTIIDYRTKPGSLAKIHYVCVQENGTGEDYTAEYMREVCYGVCFKEFVLFFGETLQYYITEEDGDKQDLTCSENLQKSDVLGKEEDNLYSMINDMIVSRSLHDYDSLDQSMDKYYNRLYMNKELFKLL